MLLSINAMKTKLLYFVLFGIGIAFLGCEPDERNLVPPQLEVRDFIWKGMNLYYLWQADVPDLDDDRFENQQQLNEYLTGFPQPDSLFSHLRTDRSIDRFSAIFSDYTVLEGVLQGVTENNGVDYGLRYKNGSTTEIFGWVRYILPNSDASTKNISRGDVFYAIDGHPLDIYNYRDLLAQHTYTLNLADYNNGAITPNGESVTLNKSAYSENPVYDTQVFNIGSHRIGYLMYNGFYPNFENQLNTAFAELRSQNITDFVLDLRYNSGGSIATATKLASLITGQFSGQLFAREQWNAKLQSYYEANDPNNLLNLFTNSSAGSLGMTTVYVLTSKSTASASELVINCLEPYINVVQIGDNTVGKNVGSITLYDSPSFGKTYRNPHHRYAMQPIVLKIVNKNGFGDYQQNGLAPDYFQPEDLDNIGTIGTESEPLLSTAIAVITGNGRQMQHQNIAITPQFSDSKAINNLQNQMYVSQKQR